MQTQESFDIFWEKKEGETPAQIESFLFRSIQTVFPESFLFSLPQAEKERTAAGFSFFDGSGSFEKALVMETAGRDELEAVLQAHLSFKQEAEAFFRGRGSRIFQPGVEVRLVLFARSFQPKFAQHLHFYGVKALLISYAIIEGGGKKGVLLRRVEDMESAPSIEFILKDRGGPDGASVQDQESLPEPEIDEERNGFFFKEIGLSSDERRALESLRLLRPKSSSRVSPSDQGTDKGEER